MNVAAFPEMTARVPPHNYEAEQALLAAILVRNSCIDDVADFLEPEHFADPAHGRIYAACRALIGDGKRADAVVLRSLLENDGDLAEIGGMAYLARLTASVVTLANTEQYGRQILDLHQRRGLILIGGDVTADAYEMPAAECLERMEKALATISEAGAANDDAVEFDRPLADVVADVEAIFRGEKKAGRSTGLADLDRKMGGLHPGDLIIIAGRPGMGKTALGLQIAYNVARRMAEHDGSPALYQSSEMPAKQLAGRLLAQAAEIPIERIRSGPFDAEEMRRVLAAERELRGLPLIIDAAPGMPVEAIRRRALRWKRRKGIGLLVVDYLQLIGQRRGARYENRTQELSEITRALKQLALELSIPVIALSQLSRQVEQRDDKRPKLSDLRESGSIEQDADIVAFAYRQEYYLAKEEPQQRAGEGQEAFSRRMDEWHSMMSACRSKAEIIIGKNRHGPEGSAQLFFAGQYARFADLYEGNAIA